MRRNILNAVAACALSTNAALSQDMPFGTDTDADYAALLWEAMVAADMVGDTMIRTVPYAGTEPHGMMLETFYTTAEIDGHAGQLIVKRNYGPEGVTADQVLADPGTHLASVTVMFRREDGYDTGNRNWFWGKYLPDGSLDQTPDGMRMAGRVAKGMDSGCIACHAAEEDYVFTTDHIGN